MKPYYEDEHVTLYHGDCIELADLWTCADVLVSDPPYGRNWRQGNLKLSGSDSHSGIANDENTIARDAALDAWGKRPAIMFGDLMLPPPGRHEARSHLLEERPHERVSRGHRRIQARCGGHLSTALVAVWAGWRVIGD